MKPIEFKGWHKTLNPPLGHENDVKGLPVWTNDLVVVSCWKMSLREKVRLLFGAKIWLQIMTHKGTQPPVAISCVRGVFKERSDQEET